MISPTTYYPWTTDHRFFCAVRISDCEAFLGSGPDRGRSPVEWGEIPFVCPSVRAPVCLSVPPLACPQTLLAGPQTPPASPHTPPTCPQTPSMKDGWKDGWMYGRTCRWKDGISPHSTGLSPLLGLLPHYPLTLHNIKEAGQGNR